jgi:hypothetical protein
MVQLPGPNTPQFDPAKTAVSGQQGEESRVCNGNPASRSVPWVLFEDADDDLVAPDRLLGRTATIGARVDADDFTRDLGDQGIAGVLNRNVKIYPPPRLRFEGLG